MDGRDRVIGNAGGMCEVWLESFLTFCVTTWFLDVNVLAFFLARCRRAVVRGRPRIVVRMRVWQDNARVNPVLKESSALCVHVLALRGASSMVIPISGTPCLWSGLEPLAEPPRHVPASSVCVGTLDGDEFGCVVPLRWRRGGRPWIEQIGSASNALRGGECWWLGRAVSSRGQFGGLLNSCGVSVSQVPCHEDRVDVRVVPTTKR